MNYPAVYLDHFMVHPDHLTNHPEYCVAERAKRVKIAGIKIVAFYVVTGGREYIRPNFWVKPTQIAVILMLITNMTAVSLYDP